MRSAWAVWQKSFRLVREHPGQLVILNLLWMAVAWLLIPIGPATMAIYAFMARSMRDEEPGLRYADLPRLFGRYFVRGVVWFLGWVVLLLCAWTGSVVWGKLLPPLAGSVVLMLWSYLVLYYVAMQPYLLEELTIEESPWLPALKKAAWQVLANPLYSHIHLVIPAAALLLAQQTSTLAGLILVSLVLLVQAVAAVEVPQKYGQGQPMDRRIEDLL